MQTIPWTFRLSYDHVFRRRETRIVTELKITNDVKNLEELGELFGSEPIVDTIEITSYSSLYTSQVSHFKFAAANCFASV